MRKGIKIVCFLLIFFMGLFFLSNLVLPKRSKEIAVDNYHDEHIGLYELPENTIDVLYIGSSHVFSSISQEDIFYNYGITGYVQASSCQKVWQSYYYLQEAYRTQLPKVVVLDTFMVLDDSPQSEAFNREAIDKMKFSLEKLKSINTAVKYNPNEEKVMSYIFPLLRYHERWEEIKEEDYAWFFTKKDSPAKGFLPRIGTVPAEFNISEYDNSLKDLPEMNKRCLDYLNKIKKLCDSKGSRLILTKFPTCLWNSSSSEMIRYWAQENNVTFMDYNADETLRENVNIDWSLESLDGGNHLNYDGAMKMSKVFGEYLKGEFAFEDKRKNINFQQWKDDYNYYKKCVDNYELNHTADAGEYFAKLMESNDFFVFSCTDFDLLDNKEVLDLLQKLGINKDNIKQMEGKNNVFIAQGDKIIYSEVSEEDICVKDDIINNKNWNISCKKQNEEIIFDCLINKKNWVTNEKGVQIVVYDILTYDVIDSNSIILTETNKLEIRR